MLILQFRKRSNITGDQKNTILDPMIISNGTPGQVWFPAGRVGFKRCPNLHDWMKCVYSPNGKEISNTSDAVIFRGFYFRDSRRFIPPVHPPHQKWVYYEYEAPARTWTAHSKEQQIWDQFNLTLTYAKDSDVPYYRYGSVCTLNPDWQPTNTNYAASKTRSILWMVSNCHDTSGREYYVRELGKYTKVDIYGTCGMGQVCGPYPLADPKCVRKLLFQYKFYLAFENSFCEDYYTEKLRRTLNLPIVPVVMGLVNYTQLIGPGTFIDVRDFTSVKELADRLNYLNNNDTAYNEYIEQKSKWKCKPQNTNKFMCHLCEYLHKYRSEINIASDARVFWGKETRCKTMKEFFTGIADSVLINMKKQ